ncbi:TonB-dependent receptor [Allosphingosinicella sp.]|uniref:TonB-dependent receptor n=1 Tax=Allosphingosinicella sp. TaxID=2823234 RepID=UPI0037834C51
MKTSLKLTTALAALTAFAGPAFAQNDQTTQASNAAQPVDQTNQDLGAADQEVTVTARRTEENLQNVPAAVSAFSARSLDRIQAQDPTGLQGAVPNLNIVPGRGSSNATNIYIRGVGQPDALQTFDPAVGLYVDGVYYSRIRGTQFDLLDLQRVEVLRGPQGTLYGKNTIGGALSFVTRRPGNEFHASLLATYGSYNQMELRGTISGPITDGVAIGLAALHAQRDGFVDDPVLRRDYNDKNTEAVRGQIAITPSSNFRIDLSADYTRDDAHLNVGQPQNNLTYLVGGGTALVLPTNPTTYDFTGRTTPSLPNSTKLRHWGMAANVALDVTPQLTLRSITAYRELNTDDYVDIDATQLQIGDVFVGVDQNQLSQEFQLTYTSDRLTAVAGLYYLREHITSHQEAFANDLIGPLLGNPTFRRTIDDDLVTKSYAAYANLSFAITPTVRLSAGGRYTSEEKDYFRTTSTFSSSPLLTSVTPFTFLANDTWHDFSPMVSLDWSFAPNAMVYVRYASGFKSGGFNGRANSVAERTEYAPETADTYEIGVRSTISNQLRLNVTGFWNNYRDFQARVSGTGLDPVTNLPSPVLAVINAGKLDIKGIEVEASWTPLPGLLFDTQVGYLHAEYDVFADARFPGGSRAFQRPAFAPRWTWRLGAQYEANLGSTGFMTWGAQMRYRSETALAVDNTYINGAVGTTTRVDGLFQRGYALVDARVVWESANRRYTIGVYGNNLFNQTYKTDGQDFSSIGSIRTVYYGAPRTAMIRAGIRF